VVGGLEPTPSPGGRSDPAIASTSLEQTISRKNYLP
jgi:hypothetical protein